MKIDWTKFLQVVELNLTELCNLTCEFCPRAHGYANNNLHMELGMAYMARDSLVDLNFTGTVSLSGKGEPTLAKNFREIANLMVGQPWSVKMNTNGKNLEKYIDVIEKFDKVYYNYYEEDWEGFLSEVEKYKKYPNFKFWYKPPVKWNEYSRSYTNRAGFMDGDYTFDLRNKPYQKYCARPASKVFIDWNGDYRLCCEDWRSGNTYSLEKDFIEYKLNHDKSVCFDNIFYTPIEEYLNTNTQLEEYRTNLLRGERTKSPCNTCSYKNTDDYDHFLRVFDEYQQYDIQSSDNDKGSDSIPLRTVI